MSHFHLFLWDLSEVVDIPMWSSEPLHPRECHHGMAAILNYNLLEVCKAALRKMAPVVRSRLTGMSPALALWVPLVFVVHT